MVDTSHMKVQPSCSSCKRQKSGYDPHKRELNTKLHLTMDLHGMPPDFLRYKAHSALSVGVTVVFLGA